MNSVMISFIIAGMAYALSASLPFWVSKNTQMAVSILIGIIANLCWVTISRGVPQNEIPLYGLIFDSILTLLFLFVPFFFIKFELTVTQCVGILMVLVGLFLTKK